MATCRFILANKAQTATILNGSGGGAPARTEVSPFVMERLLNADRRSLWKAGAPTYTAPNQWQIDLDLGSAQDVNAAALHGLSCSGGVISAAGVFYYNTYPTVFIGIGGMALNGRDAGMSFSTFNKRYWSILIEATGTPTLGRIVLGTLTDIGLAPSPGSRSSPRRNRIEQELEDGSLNINEIGFPGHDFAFNFQVATPAYRTLLEAVQAAGGTITYFDPRGRWFEIFIRRGQLECARLGEDADSLALEAGRLP